MMKSFIFILAVVFIFDFGEGLKFLGLKSNKHNTNPIHNRKIKLNVTCNFNSDCRSGFYCSKTNDCLAKKSDGSLCLTNDECECGRCYLDKIQYIRICQSNSISSCSNRGITDYNTCISNQDCPDNYYCDVRNNGICRSKVGNDRLCFDDEMCSCGKCIPVNQNHKSKQFNYNVCSCIKT